MKKLLPILFVLIITSCSKEIPSDQLVKRSDLYYEVNSKKPFTGKMVSYYENGQLKYEGSLSDGKYIGLHQRYCQNGKLNSQLNYPS